VDRQIVYPGQIPLETDLLNSNKYALIGLAKLAAAVLGTHTLLNGLGCAPMNPAALQVQLGAGEIYALANLDGTAYSSLAADTTHSLLKQGLLLDAVTLDCPPPATAGDSIAYLVQIGYFDQDSGATALPYYNAANPAQAYSGPNNSGTAQHTVRQGICQVTVKAGIAATSGSQIAPAPDPGYVGGYLVTVANGQTAITAADIQIAPAAPFITETLTQKISQASGDARYATQTGIQDNHYRSADSGGTADALTAGYTPAITALTHGMTLYVRAAAANATAAPTFTPNSGVIAAKAIVKGAGSALAVGDIAGAGHWLELQYDATLDRWVLLNPATGVSSPHKNALTNGNFDIWQRNTAFSLTTAGSNYTADRWFADIGTSGNNSTISRQAFAPGQDVVPNEPAYWLRYAVTAYVGGNPGIEQRIEGVRTFAGKQITASFWAKADAARAVTVAFGQVFGTGGAPSTPVQVLLSSFNLTTSWQQYSVTFMPPSISGKTLGANGDDCLQLIFTLPGAVCTIDLAQVQLEASPSATAFELLPPQQTLALCQRYYEKSYAQDVFPGTAITAGATEFVMAQITTTDEIRCSTFFRVSKRSIPAIIPYGTVSGVAGTCTKTLTGDTEVAAGVSIIGQQSFSAGCGPATGSGQGIMYQWTADAEL